MQRRRKQRTRWSACRARRIEHALTVGISWPNACARSALWHQGGRNYGWPIITCGQDYSGEPEGERVVGEERFALGVCRIHDLAESEDGAIWIITDEDDGKIFRLTPRP
jgi:glucose/arabinose dehydrogenase